MGKVRVHCYGCSEVVAVDERLPAAGLRIARWSLDDGETFCPRCARRRGLPDPWASGDSPDATVWWTAPDPTPASGSSGSCEPVPAGAAVDDPRTRQALARYGRRARYWLAAGATLFAVTFVFAEIKADEASQLLRTGARTNGVVQSYWRGREGSEITVRYVAQGAMREGSINIPSREEYEPGEEVEVIYDPGDPSRIRTPQDSNEGRFEERVKIYGFMVAVTLLLAGAQVMRRPRRWRKLLRTPWRPYAAAYMPGRNGRTAPGVRLTPLGEKEAEPIVLRLVTTVRQRAALLSGEPVLWVAGDPASQVVLTIPKTRELYGAAAPRGYFGRKWEAAQKPPSARAKRALSVYLILGGLLFGTLALYEADRGAWLLAVLLAAKAAAIGWMFAWKRRREAGQPDQR